MAPVCMWAAEARDMGRVMGAKRLWSEPPTHISLQGHEKSHRHSINMEHGNTKACALAAFEYKWGGILGCFQVNNEALMGSHTWLQFGSPNSSVLLALIRQPCPAGTGFGEKIRHCDNCCQAGRAIKFWKDLKNRQTNIKPPFRAFIVQISVMQFPWKITRMPVECNLYNLESPKKFTNKTDYKYKVGHNKCFQSPFKVKINRSSKFDKAWRRLLLYATLPNLKC